MPKMRFALSRIKQRVKSIMDRWNRGKKLTVLDTNLPNASGLRAEEVVFVNCYNQRWQWTAKSGRAEMVK